MAKKKADILVRFSVEFEDNGEDALLDQAVEAAEDKLDRGLEADIEVQGSVEDA